MITRPHLGLILPNYGKAIDPEVLASAALAAEEVEFDSVWVTDHLVVPSEMAPVYGRITEALVSLGFLAGRTARIRLGVSALIVPARNPVVTLKQVTSLDFLSHGRLIVAVAPGWLSGEFATLGAEFEGRGARLDEWLALVRSAFDQMPGPIHHGGAIPIEDAWLAPELARSGGPEIWVAGGGDAALRRAVRSGVWHPVALRPSEVADLAVRLRERRADGRVVLRLSTLFSDKADRDGTDERGRHAVVGPPGWIAERLAEYIAAGCDGFVVNLDHEAPALAERIRRFATDVWPVVVG